MILTFSFSISIRYARTQVIPETTAIDNVLRIFFRDEIFFVLVRFWLFFHRTLTVMIINITTLLMRIMVTGTRNDHKNGTVIKPLLVEIASQHISSCRYSNSHCRSFPFRE